MQVHSELNVEAILQLVSGNWPLLETLILTFTDVNEQVVNTLVTGDWPMLKELHIKIQGFGHHWDRQCVDSWQTAEQGCYNVCRNRWPGLKVKLPKAETMKERLERHEHMMSSISDGTRL